MSTAAIGYTVWPTQKAYSKRYIELERKADTLVRGALCLNLRDRIEAADPVDWEAGTLLLESDNPGVQRLGTLFLLNALATTPNTAREAAQQVLVELQSVG